MDIEFVNDVSRAQPQHHGLTGIGPRLLLMTNRKSHTRFRLVPKSTTLDDLEWPLRTLFQNTCVFRRPYHEYVNEDRLHCQRRRCSAMTLDSGNTRYIRIFAGFPRKGASYKSGVIEKVFFRTFGHYVFGTLGNEANIIIYHYFVPCRLSTEAKTRDLE